MGASPLNTFLILILAGRFIQETTCCPAAAQRSKQGMVPMVPAYLGASVLSFWLGGFSVKLANTQQRKTVTMTTTTTTGGVGGTTSSPHTTLVPLLPCISLAAVALLLIYQLLVSRPRSKGGSRGPPVVTTSPVIGIPVVGTILEFGRSPVKMVQRCYDDYGPVFTVPVRVP